MYFDFNKHKFFVQICLPEVNQSRNAIECFQALNHSEQYLNYVNTAGLLISAQNINLHHLQHLRILQQKIT